MSNVSESQPYGSIAWRDIVEHKKDEQFSHRVLLIGPGSNHVIENVGLEDVLVLDTTSHGSLKLPFAVPGTLGNQVGVRMWKGQFNDLPYYYGPFDAIIFASCIGGNLLQKEQVMDCLKKAVVTVKDGGYIIFQELDLLDSTKWQDFFDFVEESGVDELPLKKFLRGNSCIVFRVPNQYHFDESPLRLKAKVVSGFGRGSKQLGFPTANMHVPSVEERIKDLPKGVYFGWVRINFKDNRKDEVHKAVVNIGQRPTFDDGSNVTIEAHILHKYETDFYGEEMRLTLVGFLRPEMKFDSFQDLVQRIKQDIGISKKQLDSEVLQELKSDPFIFRTVYSKKLFQVNAKWTSVVPLMGWRHFRIVTEKKGEGGMVEVMAVCDREKRCWIDKATLKKDINWIPGWIDPPE